MSRLLILILSALLSCGCANPIITATKASNAAAHVLTATHKQLTEQRRADQMAAAKAVQGDRSDPATKEKQVTAAKLVGVRYRPAWKAYMGARFAWVQLVAALKLAKEHPALLDPGSLAGLVATLVAAQADLKAAALAAMQGVKALRDDAPPPAPVGAAP